MSERETEEDTRSRRVRVDVLMDFFSIFFFYPDVKSIRLQVFPIRTQMYADSISNV